jgi:2,4-dienoyl-CoA reductase-like NADH-dependent reductase (Old Yellow Enzyme family)
MLSTHPLILTPYDINTLTVRNRFAVAPMSRVTATETGVPTSEMVEYYAGFAKGGFGLITTEGLYIDHAFSQGYRNQPGISDAEQATGWASVTHALHSEGAVAFAQLMHAGALSQYNRFRTHTMAPSAVQPRGEQMKFYHGQGVYPVPAAMTDSDIADTIEAFASSADRAFGLAGFDGVEIHGANGYLLDQFLTAHTNTRSDRRNGDMQARVGLLTEVVKAVKSRSANRGPVGIRISQGKVNDFTAKWAGGEADAEVIFGSLADAGADFIHVTEFEAWQPAFPGGSESLLTLARRYAPATTIIVNGSLHLPGRSAEALEHGADIVAFGRGALANPDLAQRMVDGRVLEPFDSSILGPIADIKPVELAARAAFQ